MQATNCVSDPGIPLFSFFALCLITQPPPTKQCPIVNETCVLGE